VNLRPWGDAILATDSTTAWLLNATKGDIIATRNLASDEKAHSVAENPDNLVVQIGAIALANDRAFIGMGTSVIAIDRLLGPIWRMARPYGERSAPVPRVANDTWVAIHTVEGTVVKITLRDASTGVREWFVSYDPGRQPVVGGGPPPPNEPPPGSTGGGPPPAPPPGHARPPSDTWSQSEGRLGAAHLALRDASSFRVLDLAKGDTVWAKVSDKPIAGIEVVADLMIVAADKLTAYALNHDETTWQEDLRGALVAATPDGKRIVAANESGIAALDLAGNYLWRAPLPPSVAGHGPDRLTTDDHTAMLTFDPPPGATGLAGVDTVAISIDG
jgi:hypothetical protein